MLAMGDVDASLAMGLMPASFPVVLYGKWCLNPVSRAGWIAVGILPDEPYNKALRAWQQAIGRRHDGRWQMSYCDGHVEKNRIDDLFDTRNPAGRQRWNRDNAPHPEINLQLQIDVFD